MNDVYLCHLIEPHAHGKPQRGGRTVLTFVAGTDEARAHYLVGAAADAWFDATGVQVNWHVEPIPYAGSMNEGALLQHVREAATA